jgi:hypothetical protein
MTGQQEGEADNSGGEARAEGHGAYALDTAATSNAPQELVVVQL